MRNVSSSVALIPVLVASCSSLVRGAGPAGPDTEGDEGEGDSLTGFAVFIVDMLSDESF